MLNRISTGPPAKDLAPWPSFIAACDECHVVREADHRIANHLTLLAGFVRLKSAGLTDDMAALGSREVRLLLQGICAQLETVAHMHRALLAETQVFPDLGQYLHSVCDGFSSVLAGRIALIEALGADCHLSAGSVLPVTQIVSEAITNAIKHARPLGDGCVITVGCRKADGGRLVVEIADNGWGLPDRFDPATDGGLGFRLIRGLASQAGARLAFRSGTGGLVVELNLPAAPDLEPLGER